MCVIGNPITMRSVNSNSKFVGRESVKVSAIKTLAIAGADCQYIKAAKLPGFPVKVRKGRMLSSGIREACLRIQSSGLSVESPPQNFQGEG